VRYIDIDDAESVLRAIADPRPDHSIEIILHTPGGIVIAARQIASALADHPGHVTAVVPHYAMSGGTLIALAADGSSSTSTPRSARSTRSSASSRRPR
jgi:ClpP class serine protease